MKKHILVFNAGSSTVKFDLFSVKNECPKRLIDGKVENIGAKDACLDYYSVKNGQKQKHNQPQSIKDHSEATKRIVDLLIENGVEASQLMFIGHRVVHGGTSFTKDCAYLLDDETVKKIDSLCELAPLHNPVNLQGIKDTMKAFPEVPQVAVFDTTFHSTIPEVAHNYALPREKFGPEVRKFGFHGISYRYITSSVEKYFEENVNKIDGKLRFICLHLGNGCSACAINDGKSVETSMGLTPLQGLIMGSRVGDIDPATVFHLHRKYGKSLDEIEKMMNSESGLKGLCGDNDMRTITKNKDSDDKMKLAFEMFCYRVRQYVGNYFVTLGGAHAIVFTGGIGENSSDVRSKVCKGLECLGVDIDSEKNKNLKLSNGDEKPQEISTGKSKVKVLVVKTQEELQLVLMGRNLLSQKNRCEKE